MLVQYFRSRRGHGQHHRVAAPRRRMIQDSRHARQMAPAAERGMRESPVTGGDGRAESRFETVIRDRSSMFATTASNRNRRQRRCGGWFWRSSAMLPGFVYITSHLGLPYLRRLRHHRGNREDPHHRRPAESQCSVPILSGARSGLPSASRAKARKPMKPRPRWPPSSQSARYRCQRFFFWDALPKSGYGKVPKR